ncbi:LPXTG cell wall anchor domain-containing protein [Plantibacter sp. VKM Ac-2885]|nr:LPXTG cell wall anchor domain-containing protein [Plantibacter sp. VKM Ac-2885]
MKSASRDAVTAAGQVIQYSFLITNTGNVTLHDVSVSEGTFTGTGTLSAVKYPTRVLLPGQSTTATAEYTVTAADLANGPLRNTATATGTPPGGTPISSPPSSVTVSVPPKPPLASTGVAGVSLLAGGAALLLLLGAGLMVRNRRRSSTH